MLYLMETERPDYQTLPQIAENLTISGLALLCSNSHLIQLSPSFLLGRLEGAMRLVLILSEKYQEKLLSSQPR